MSHSHGIHALFTLAARERCMTNFKRIIVPKYGNVPSTKAAVLVPICKVKNIPSLLYTVRSSTMKGYSGEVSFPGGKTNPNETAIQTALRETYEEIGIHKNKIEVWGQGAPVPGKGNKMLITPVIGSIEEVTKNDMKADPNEVSEVFTVPVEMLCDPKNQFYTQFANGFILPVFKVEEYKIWGITAFITHAVLSSALSKDVYKNEWMKKKVLIERGIQIDRSTTKLE